MSSDPAPRYSGLEPIDLSPEGVARAVRSWSEGPASRTPAPKKRHTDRLPDLWSRVRYAHDVCRGRDDLRFQEGLVVGLGLMRLRRRPWPAQALEHSDALGWTYFVTVHWDNDTRLDHLPNMICDAALGSPPAETGPRDPNAFTWRHCIDPEPRGEYD